MQTTTLGRDLIEALNDQSPATGLTHGYYHYPAQFSPRFARHVIDAFSEPGGIVVDPFMGGGTALVEAMVLGRAAVGSDINPLATFVTRVKCTPLADITLSEIKAWWESAYSMMKLNRPSLRSQPWADLGYQKDLPWPIRMSLEFVLQEIDALTTRKARRFVRCAVLKAAQWAIDGRRNIPSAYEFREKLETTLSDQIRGNIELRRALSGRPKPSHRPVVRQNKASRIEETMDMSGLGSADLVITSPPYPGVHVLYHRWQVHGRKETPAPYWIIDHPDGKGGSLYTMGSRSDQGIDDYFETLEESFSALRKVISPDGRLVQLISFSNSESQLDRYLEIMEKVGFDRIEIHIPGITSGSIPARMVPNRKWHARLQGRTDSAIEYLLVHVPA